MNTTAGSTRNLVLVVGSGGREHALAWKLSKSRRVSQVIVAPGNDGMSDWLRWPTDLSKGRPEFERLADRALAEKVSLAVIGPDNPLADGIVDVFEARGIRCFGPTAAAARIEASKGFAKEVMTAAHVPTARYHLALDRADAERFLRSADWTTGWVVKVDGLALGKGVHVCATVEEALRAVEILPEGPLVLEEKLNGEEISWMAFCDGERCSLLAPARDYKRISDGDRGPNTGGMGALSPVPGIPDSWADRVRNEVFLPTLAEMKKRGSPFRGVLFAGLMVDVARDRISVLEFNARFGDPETQVLLARMTDDLFFWCNAVALGDLLGLPGEVAFAGESAVTVVAAARGYPDHPEKGAVISGEKPVAPRCFYAGVALKQGRLTVSGGRVLAAVGKGPDLKTARAEAYAVLSGVRFDGMQFRSDIGGRG